MLVTNNRQRFFSLRADTIMGGSMQVGAERVFMMLQNSFSKQPIKSLEDYVSLSVNAII